MIPETTLSMVIEARTLHKTPAPGESDFVLSVNFVPPIFTPKHFPVVELCNISELRSLYLDIDPERFAEYPCEV